MEEIRVDGNNVRIHGDVNRDVIKKSLKECGAGRSIVMDADNVIIAGNGVYEQAKELGLNVKIIESDGSELIVVKRTDLKGDDEKRKLLALADNRAAELAEWDTVALEKLMKDIPDISLDGMGFDDDFMASLGVGTVSGAEGNSDAEPKVNKGAELNKKWDVKVGDIWMIGGHRLMCGDSTSKNDVGMLMGDGGAVFCFTSPPYGDMRDYNGCDLSVEKMSSFITAASEYCRFYAVNLGLKRKDGEIDPYWDTYIDVAKKCGLKFTAWNIWSRAGMGGSIANMTAMFPIEHEWVLIFGGDKDSVRATKKNKSAGLHKGITNRQKDGSTKAAAPKMVKEYGRMGSVFTSCYASGEKDHPAAFPVVFPQEYVKACSGEGDIVYEPFMGSGTTMVACENVGRICVGMEISPEYCAVVLERMAEAFPSLQIKKA